MILRRTLAATAVAVLVAAVSATAQPAPPAEPKPPIAAPGLDARGDRARTAEDAFTVLDDDGSGQVDRAEWQTRKMAIFYVRDVDNNLQLSRGELPKLGPDRFSEADLNKDGALSGYEFNQAAFSQFERADGDGNGDSDGAVSASEFRVYMATGGGAR